MIQGYFGAFLFGLAGVCDVMVFVKSESYVRNPFGQRMCERLCNQMIGCSNYMYMTSDLSCHVNITTSGTNTPEKGIYLFIALKDDERIYAERHMPCSKNSMLFHTRRNSLICRSLVSRRLRKGDTKERHIKTFDATERNQEKNNKPEVPEKLIKPKNITRVLMLAHTYSGQVQQGRQLFLNNNSLVTYPYWKEQAWAVIYISTNGKLVIANRKSSEVYLVPLDTSKKVIISRSTKLFSMAVDETRCLVFLLSSRPWKAICRMTTDGKNISKVVPFKCIGDIAVDPKRSMIYVTCLHKRMVRFTYQGVFKSSLLKNPSLGWSVYVDSEGDCLYFMMGKPSTIYRMTLTNRSVVTFVDLDFTALAFSVIENTFYVTTHYLDGEITRVSADGKMETLMTGLTKCSIKLCGIP